MDNDQLHYLTKVLIKQKNFLDLLKLLDGILTENEIKLIVNRLNIIELIKLGFSHRAIKKELDTGMSTINWISREFQTGKFDNLKK